MENPPLTLMGFRLEGGRTTELTDGIRIDGYLSSPLFPFILHFVVAKPDAAEHATITVSRAQRANVIPFCPEKEKMKRHAFVNCIAEGNTFTCDIMMTDSAQNDTASLLWSFIIMTQLVNATREIFLITNGDKYALVLDENGCNYAPVYIARADADKVEILDD